LAWLIQVHRRQGGRRGALPPFARHAAVNIGLTYPAVADIDSQYIQGLATPATETDADWQRLFEINIMSGVRLARHYLKYMLHRNHGRIVFISSESGISPAPEMAHYSATKAMQLSISRSLAELTKGTKVTVNSVLPGPTRTQGVEKFIRDVYPDIPLGEAEKKFMSNNRPSSLIARLINPAEIADVVTFIISERASIMNGSSIRAEEVC
jgi:3-oxoacyl-[acyl-carrier protein] reductase